MSVVHIHCVFTTESFACMRLSPGGIGALDTGANNNCCWDKWYAVFTAQLLHCQSAASWVKKLEQEVATFRQLSAIFQQERLWELKISTLPLSFWPRNWEFLPQIMYFWKKIFDKKTIFQQAKTWEDATALMPLPATTPVVLCYHTCKQEA